MTQTRGASWALQSFLALVVLGVFVGAAGVFATHQVLWVDETTQLSGLGLDLGEQYRWLTGQVDPGLGVPPDRMPPLSYWLGEAWGAVFGYDEAPMRWLGIAAYLAAAPALWLSGRLAGGIWGGLFALGFVLLSPGLIIQAVEIRTYPIYFALSAWAIWAFAHAVLAEERQHETRQLVQVALFAVAAAYAHYFGLLMALCLFAALVVDRWRRGWRLAPLLAVGAGAVIACLGLVPFAFAAIGVSGGAEGLAGDTPGLSELLRGALGLVLRLASHGTHLVYPAAFGAVMLGVAILGFMTFLHPAPSASQTPSGPPRGVALILLLPIALALVLLLAIDRALDGFPAFGPHYNTWMVPLLALFLARAFHTSTPWRLAAWGGGALVVLGHLGADAVLMRYPTLYTHGPGEWIAAFIPDPDTTLVVHDGAGNWGHAYFPVVFLSDQQVVQILVTPDGTAQELIHGGTRPVPPPEVFLSGFETVLVLSARNLSSRDLAAMARGETRCDPRALPDYLTAWALPQTRPPDRYCGFAAATLLRSDR